MINVFQTLSHCDVLDAWIDERFAGMILTFAIGTLGYVYQPKEARYRPIT